MGNQTVRRVRAISTDGASRDDDAGARAAQHRPLQAAERDRTPGETAVAGRSSGHEHLLGLQRTIGNQATQRLLAQGESGLGSSLRAPIQRKLSFNNTQWSSARYLAASSGGGGGVLFVGEAGKEVVLKPGEDMATEGALAAMLHKKVAKKGKHPTLGIAPGLRVVSPDESREAKAALDPLLQNVGENAPDVEGVGGKQFLKNRAQNLVGMLERPGVVVQDMAQGKEFEEAIKGVQKHTEKKFFGGRKLRKDSPLRIFQDVRAIRALGSTAAVDLFTGNKDRLFMYNAQNFMVTPQSLTMIDNVWMGTDMSYFQTTEVEGRGGKKFTITADEALTTWKNDTQVKALAAGNFDLITAHVFERIVQNAASDTRAVDRNSFNQVMNDSRAKFTENFNAGLREGKAKVVASLDALLKKPAQLQKLVPQADLTEILATIKKRRDFLVGGQEI